MLAYPQRVNKNDPAQVGEPRRWAGRPWARGGLSIGAQDPQKCSNLLAPTFAHGNEISFGIRYLCTITVKSSQNHQKNGANASMVTTPGSARTLRSVCTAALTC